MPWRTAHQIVAIMVRLCEERGLGPADVTPALLDEAAMLYHEQPAGLDQQSIDESLDPERFIAVRTLRGGPAKDESLRQARVFGEALARDEQIVSGIDERLVTAARKLEEAVDAIIARGAKTLAASCVHPSTSVAPTLRAKGYEPRWWELRSRAPGQVSTSSVPQFTVRLRCAAVRANGYGWRRERLSSRARLGRGADRSAPRGARCFSLATRLLRHGASRNDIES
jgi:hypothetical protein